MASVNKAILVGYVGKDPVINALNSGDKVAKFTLATSENWKEKNTGERREKTEWHNVVVYNDRLAGFVGDYIKKGARVYVEGHIETRKYTDQGGAERYITEIVLQKFRGEIVSLSGKDESGGGAGNGGAERRENAEHSDRRPADFDDDIPF